ncbi:MAG: HAMP domain-containing sensor histidine kinase [Vicinamibacterales bacterium]
MRSRRSVRIIVSYVLSLVVALSLLVWWIVYVLQASATINRFGERLGGGGTTSQWLVLGLGCALFVVLIVGLTFQLAHALAERNYSRKQDEFVSNITHEMKSPLAAIKLHAQTLQELDLPTEDRERSVAFILQQVGRMSTLVDNVLESSRLAARQRRPTLEPLALAEWCGPFLDEMRGVLDAGGIRLRSELSTSAVVMASPDALRRILTNLLENGARFSTRGGELRCRVFDQGDHVCIEVEDDGVGIPRSELHKVFDRFYQIGKEISGRRGGTGLGLSIVWGLVKEMRGQVRAFSQEGRPGTRFVVTLPVAQRGGA